MKERVARKIDYRKLSINVENPKFYEELVSLDDYDIPGQSYYSRPNAALSEAVSGVPERPMLRKSLAETIAHINERLEDPLITEFFGGEVEVYVEDGTRPTSLQRQLFDTTIPNLLARNHPGMTEEEIDKRRREIIAEPSLDALSVSPHATGGAVDATLRYKQKSKLFVEGANVWLGHTDGDTGESIAPDYYEKKSPLTEADILAQRNRRAFYSIMTGEAFDEPTGLVVNPTEIWHWSIGDQLWASQTGETAYYGSVEAA
jgi:D-alanyl-D-alanine dipeptidase